MAVRRVSQSSVDLLGVKLSAQLNSGALANVFQVGDGSQKTTPADVRTLTTVDAELAWIDGPKYDALVSVLQSRGADTLVAQSLAAVLLDVGRALRVNPLSLLSQINPKQAQLTNNQAYFIINQLRLLTSQTSKATSVNNQQSLVSDQIIFSTPVPKQSDWASGTLVPVANPPTLVDQRTRWVSFDAQNKFLAVTTKNTPDHLDIYAVNTWQPIAQVNLDTMVPTVTGISFSPTQALLAVGIYSPDTSQGLKIISTHVWQSQPTAPSFAFVNSVSFDRSGTNLAVIYAATTTGFPLLPDQVELQVLNRTGWTTQFQIGSTPFEAIDVAFSPTQDIMAVYGSLGTVGSAQVRFYSYDQNNWQLVGTRPIPGGSTTYGAFGPNIAFDQTGQFVLVPGGELSAFDVLVIRVDGFQAPIPVNTSINRVYSVRPIPDQSLVVLVGAVGGGQTQVISFVETNTWTEVAAVTLPGVDFLPTVSVNTSGEFLAVGDITIPATGNPKIFTAAQVPI